MPHHVSLKGTSSTKGTGKGNYPNRMKFITPGTPGLGSLGQIVTATTPGQIIHHQHTMDGKENTCGAGLIATAELQSEVTGKMPSLPTK